ncbi:MAG: tetratricopeptide repeat protein [Deltaproteobacteria bacterium]|nr:tetratricopeptide repeat protein [Deltaproteobacteria bacterium]
MGFDRRKTLASAQKSLMKGQIRKAISDYEKLVADDPRNIRIRSKLADLYLRNKNFDRAVEEYIQLAQQYKDEDLSYRAISMYKKVLTVRPKMIDVHYWLADLYKKEGLVGNAKVLYQNIIKLNPEDQLARSAIAEIDRTLAQADSFQMEEETSDFGEAGLGEINGREQRSVLEQALMDDELPETQDLEPEEVSESEEIVDLEEPLQSEPADPQPAGSDGHHTAGNPYFTHQEVVLDQSVSPEKDLESHYHLGIAYMEMELIDKAIVEFEAALEYGPKRIDCLVMLGQCYGRKGAFDRSIFYLEKASKIEGLTEEDHIRISKELAKAYEACGMRDKASQAFNRAGLGGGKGTTNP